MRTVRQKTAHSLNELQQVSHLEIPRDAIPRILVLAVSTWTTSSIDIFYTINIVSIHCRLKGWGRLSSGGSSPSELMQAEVPLVSNERCSKSYGRIHDSMLCAGHDEGGVDACQGDSGGPLVCKYGGKWHVEGATSWGKGCARPQYFGVYAKVRYMLDWVHEKMASN